MTPQMQSNEAPRIPFRLTPKPWILLVSLSIMFGGVFLDRGPPSPLPRSTSQPLGVIGAKAVNGERRSEENPKGKGLQGALDLSYVEFGLLSSLYMIGRMIGPAVFSQFVRYYDALHIIGYGMIMWIVGAVTSGLAPEFISMAIARLLAGIGGSAVVAITIPIIDDKAPRQRKALWIAIVNMQNQIGISAGYALGAWMEAALGWRSAFIVGGLLMVPFTVLCFMMKPLTINRGHEHDAATSVERGAFSELKILWEDSKTIFSQPVYFFSIVGFSIHVGVLGTMLYWQAKAIDAIFHQKGTDVWMAASISSVGIIGNASGGLLLDRIGSTMTNALTLSSIANLLCGIILIPSFLFVQNFYLFLILFSLGTLIRVIQMAPVGVVLMSAVPLHLRPLSVSYLLLSMHLLGDIPSPVLFGQHLELLEDDFNQSEAMSYRIAIAVATMFFIAAAGVYAAGSIVAKNAKDYRAEHHPAHEAHDTEVCLLQDMDD